MQRITVDSVDFVPLKSLLGIVTRLVFFFGLAVGLGGGAMVPYLAQLSIWSNIRAEKLAESMMNEAARCEAKMMVMEQACPMKMRVARAAKQMRNMGGE